MSYADVFIVSVVVCAYVLNELCAAVSISIDIPQSTICVAATKGRSQIQMIQMEFP